MYRHIPNLITLSRIIVVPPTLILAFLIPNSPKIHLLVLLLTITIAVSDTLDGRLARRWHCVSDFGKKWDPIADKLAVMMYLPLVWLGMIHFIPVLVIFARDALSTFLRLWAKKAIAARFSGKVKTVVNLVCMCGLIAAVPVKGGYIPLLPDLAWLLYWLNGTTITAVCLWSGWDYYRALVLRSRE